MLILVLAVSVTYVMLPDRKESLSYSLPGAIVTVVGWLSAGYLFSFYIKTFNQFSIIYGSIAGIVSSMIFFYILSITLVFGAEFNYIFRRLYARS